MYLVAYIANNMDPDQAVSFASIISLPLKQVGKYNIHLSLICFPAILDLQLVEYTCSFDGVLW